MVRSIERKGAQTTAPARKKRSAAPAPATRQSSIVEGDDGFFWLDSETDALVGPFRTRAEAIADRDSPGLSSDALYDAAAEAEAVHEMEAEIGIDDFIDPDTGEPTHGYEPHVRDDH
jgi:hypothetical protein